LDFPWLGKCCVVFLLDLYIYFGFPLARLEWRILLKSVRLPLQAWVLFCTGQVAAVVVVLVIVVVVHWWHSSHKLPLKQLLEKLGVGIYCPLLSSIVPLLSTLQADAHSNGGGAHCCHHPLAAFLIQATS
jgi:hypothetical protein